MKKKPSLFLCLFLLLCPLLTGQDQIILGREDNWQESSFKNILLKKGWEGHMDLNVMGSVYRPTDKTDLLLPFDEERVFDETGRYSLEESANLTEYEYRRGKRAALFKEATPLIINPGPDSLFSGQAEWNDFSLEFQLYPALLQEGEVIFHWKGLYQQGEELVPQEIICRISRRALVWTFRNIFIDREQNLSTFTLRGDAMVPRRWNHHLVRFDSDTGLLEYLIDGIPAALTYTTPSGREERHILEPQLNQSSPTPLELGSEFTGFIDEVRLSRENVEHPLLDDYEERGDFLSPLIDLEYQDSLLQSIEAVDRIGGNSTIYYYYAFSDRKEELEKLRRDFSRTDFSFTQSPWLPFQSDEELEESRGRYLLIGAQLYPDLGAAISPTISEFRINYQAQLPPVPPLNLAVHSQEGKVTLSWDYWKNEGMGGFLIYYGDRPGQYFGAASPIVVDREERHYTIEGLEPRKRWYFSVVAFSDSDPAQYSSFSREVSVRP
ncbi:MAG: fibronectin type III domain-containing protein [Spirochaetales bacterium]|nr:fibronectin type III domain-containing protein [Spirochaetales bacterium]